MNNARLLARPNQQSGMTLIEILVAIVVLSIGLLGLAGLQLKGMQVNQGSVYRWQAAMLAEDLADRMRADRTNALNGVYTETTAAPATGGGQATQLAIGDWNSRVQALPGGNATVSAPVANGAQTTIQIQIGWTDTRAATGAGAPNGGAAVPGTFVLYAEL